MEGSTQVISQYAQDLLVECGWDRKAINAKLRANWLRRMADVDPSEWNAQIDKILEVRGETERVLINREAVRDRYSEFFPQKNQW